MTKVTQASVSVDSQSYAMPAPIKGLIDSLQIFNDVLIDENEILKAQNEEFSRYCSTLEQRIEQLEKNNKAARHGLNVASYMVNQTPAMIADAMTRQRSADKKRVRAGRTSHTDKLKHKALEIFDEKRANFKSDKQTADAIFQDVFNFGQTLVPRVIPSEERFYTTLLEAMSRTQLQV